MKILNAKEETGSIGVPLAHGLSRWMIQLVKLKVHLINGQDANGHAAKIGCSLHPIPPLSLPITIIPISSLKHIRWRYGHGTFREFSGAQSSNSYPFSSTIIGTKVTKDRCTKTLFQRRRKFRFCQTTI